LIDKVKIFIIILILYFLLF